MKQKILHLIAISAATVAFCGLLFADGDGPLVPPAAPADGTYRTLGELWDKLEALETAGAAQTVELEPRVDIATLPSGSDSDHVITTPGSYYLSGNIETTANANGIWVNAPDVTIDLNGFRITRLGAATGAGIVLRRRDHRCTIHSGFIAGFENGIADGALTGSDGPGGTLRDLIVSDCSGDGIFAPNGWVIDRCVATENGGNGFAVLGDLIITDCVSRANGAAGFSLGRGSLMTKCKAFGNTGPGVAGPSGQRIKISGCLFESNAGGGVVGGIGSVSECVVTGAASVGIELDGGSRIADCKVTFGTTGIVTTTGSEIRDCRVSGCSVAGIHVSNVRNTIQGNFVSSCEIGFSIAGAGNLVFQNRANGNTPNYEIAAGNKVGTIVVPPNSLAISGSTGGAGLGTTDPWANFSY